MMVWWCAVLRWELSGFRPCCQPPQTRGWLLWGDVDCLVPHCALLGWERGGAVISPRWAVPLWRGPLAAARVPPCRVPSEKHWPGAAVTGQAGVRGRWARLPPRRSPGQSLGEFLRARGTGGLQG